MCKKMQIKIEYIANNLKLIYNYIGDDFVISR